MKVSFLRGLPPERQAKVYDIWSHLRDDPTGGYSASSVAEAMMDRIREISRANALAFEDGSISRQWYRRYRLNGRRKARPRTPGYMRDAVRRSIRRAVVPA
jgi:hypothetical protein